MKKYFLIASFALAISMKGAVVPAALEQELKNSKGGDIVSLSSLAVNKAEDVINSSAKGASMVATGGKLIYSDDPETVKGYGILYQDDLISGQAGTNRIYIYHVNGMEAETRITAVIENTSASDAVVKYLHKSLPQPSSDYLDLGRKGACQFYQNTNLPSEIVIKPGEAALLDTELDGLAVKHEQLVGGIYDISSTLQLNCTILMLPLNTDTLKEFRNYGFVAKDGRNRLGSFSNKSKRAPNESYLYDSASGAKYFEIASNVKYTQNDLPLTGIVPQTQQTVQLLGNYGVTYKINVQAENGSEGYSRLAVVLCPRGGAYTGFIRFTDGSGNVLSDQVIPVVSDNTKGAVCGFVDLPSSAYTMFTIEFMPAGSTSLPVWLLLIPIH